MLSGFDHLATRRLAPLVIAALILAASWHPAWAEDDDPVAATVNGETITRGEILLALELVPAQIRQMPPQQLFALIREQLIDIKLLAAKGAAAGLDGVRELPRASISTQCA